LTNEIARNLNLYDVVYVHVSGQNGSSTKDSDAGSSKGNVQARLRVRPSVQGAALVLEN
jgi:hypothetical protein